MQKNNKMSEWQYKYSTQNMNVLLKTQHFGFYFISIRLCMNWNMYNLYLEHVVYIFVTRCRNLIKTNIYY